MMGDPVRELTSATVPSTVSRRNLLRAGTIAAGAAAVSLTPTRVAPAQAQALPLPPAGCPHRIDVHCHHIPDFYRVAMAQHGHVTAGGIPIPPWTPELAVAFMNNYGIQAQVVSISEPGVTFVADPQERLQLARQVNDWTRETLLDTTSKLTGGRFGAFGLLPLRDASPVDVTNASLEAIRCMAELELDGIGMFSHYSGVYLGDPRLDPLMATLNTLGAMVFVHPVIPAGQPDLLLPEFLFEFPFDTTRAAVNMSYLQVFTRYPNIRWTLAHAGGTLPYLAYRTSLLQAYPVAAQNLGLADFDDQNLDWSRLFYDTALSPAPSAMKAVREVTSVDHVLFATDWPFSYPVFVVPGDPAPQLDDSFNASERRMVERHNALAQFPRLAARVASCEPTAASPAMTATAGGASGGGNDTHLPATGGGAGTGAGTAAAGAAVRRWLRRTDDLDRRA